MMFLKLESCTEYVSAEFGGILPSKKDARMKPWIEGAAVTTGDEDHKAECAQQVYSKTKEHAQCACTCAS